MMYSKNQATAEKEARLQDTIATVKDNKYTCHATAKVFCIPCRTLYDRVNEGKKPRNLAHEHNQNLIHNEEKELVQWITCLTISGYPSRYETLQQLAEIIRKQHVKLNSDEVQNQQGMGFTFPTMTFWVVQCLSTFD